MRILFLNQYYYPDIAATAQILADLCEDLAQAGHSVTVLCGSARYRLPHRGLLPEVADEKSAPLPKYERHRGVHIRRVLLPPPLPSASAKPARLWHRAVTEARFCLGVLRELRNAPQNEPPQAVVVLSSPPLLLFLGRLARAHLGVPLVYWVQDVYPELMFALNVLSRKNALGKLADALLTRLWQWMYRGVDAAIVLDEAMKETMIAAKLPKQRLHVIEHFADCQEITPQPPAQNRLRQSLGIGDGLIVGYAGNLGRGHDFETVRAALQRLGQNDAPPDAARLHFLFVGEGAKKAALFDAIPKALRHRVHFLPPQARSELRDVLTAGDIGLITLEKGLCGLMTPSKLYALLAAGRPIVYVGPPSGRVAELCDPSHPNRIGESVRNGDAAGLCQAFLRLLRDEPYRHMLAERARRLAVDSYDRRVITAQHAKLLAQIIAASPSISAPGADRKPQ